MAGGRRRSCGFRQAGAERSISAIPALAAGLCSERWPAARSQLRSKAMPRCVGARCGGCSNRWNGSARALVVSEEGRLPLTLSGAREPIPIVFEPTVPSAQLKSAVLLAGLSAPGETVVVEAEATRDHTEKMLAHFGADLRRRGTANGRSLGRRITLVGQPELLPQPIVVPADPSSAAFPLVAAVDHARLRPDPRGRDAQSAPYRAAHDACRDGRCDRTARNAQRRRRGGRGLARASQSRCRASRSRPRVRQP